MISKRSFLTLVVASLLAACSTPSIRTEGDTRVLNVQSVNVSSANLEKGVTGRVNTYPKEQVENDVTAAVLNSLSAKSNPEGLPVVVDIDLASVRLVSPGQALLIGGNSQIVADVSVADVKDGTLVVPVTRVVGSSERVRLGGIIGAATSPSVENDYRATLSGFATKIKQALFGADS